MIKVITTASQYTCTCSGPLPHWSDLSMIKQSLQSATLLRDCFHFWGERYWEVGFELVNTIQTLSAWSV